MSSKLDYEKQKVIQEKCQIILGNLLREEDNKYCVDCDAKCPRWASWNIGVFLCIRCAGVHRNLGVHISRVKSVSLDTWTPEQVASLQQMGNSQARAVYEANLPDSFKRPQADAPLEAFIRAKYEQKKYIAKDWVAPKPALGIEDGKQKEKKTKVEIKALSQPPHCSLPSPKVSESVKTEKTVQKETSLPVVQQQMPGSVDLFNVGESTTGDDDDDDSFGEFLSAPMPQDAAPITNISFENSAPVTDAEADFFNQKSDGNTSKLTKDSILSLYTSNSTCPVPAHEQTAPMYGIPAMYVQQQAFAMTGYPEVSTTGINPVQQPMANLQLSGYPEISTTGINPVQQPMANLQLSGYPKTPNAGINPFQQPMTNLQLSGYPELSTAGINPVQQQMANLQLSGYPELSTTGINPVQQQMANLQLTGQTWNIAGNVPVPVNIPVNMPVNSSPAGPGNLGSNQSSGVIWPPVNNQNQKMLNNIWQ